MLQRFVEIKEIMKKVDDTEVQDLLLDDDIQINIVKLLCKMLSDLDSVTIALKSTKVSVADAPDLYDAVVAHNPETKSRISQTAQIVERSSFESAICKIQCGEESCHSTAEMKTVSHFRVLDTATPSGTVSTSTFSWARIVMKKREVSNELSKSGYLDLSFIVPSSSICDRLFNVARYAQNDSRKCILPENMESQLFLHESAHLWCFAEVHRILQ